MMLDGVTTTTTLSARSLTPEFLWLVTVLTLGQEMVVNYVVLETMPISDKRRVV
jgi:hypothetical protein